MPASSVASGAALATCFAPEEDCAAFAVRAIDNAEHEILVGAYGLTTGSGIVEALVRAKQRGVDVRLIADKNHPLHAEERDWRVGGRWGADLDRCSATDRPREDDGDRRRGHLDGLLQLDDGRRAELRRSEPSLVADGRRRLCGSLAHASCRLGPV
jgi:hypothetical protein